MYNYVQNNKRMKYNKNLLEKLKEFILTLVWTKESLTTIQSKYFINIFTYIVGQKCFLQFSSTVYYRVNEVWNMIYTNIPSCSAYVKTMNEYTLHIILLEWVRPPIAPLINWSITQQWFKVLDNKIFHKT